MPGFKETWESIPFVTKYATCVAAVMYMAYCFNPYYAVFAWNYAGAPRWEVWRYVLSVLSYNGSKLQGFLEVIALATSLNQLETLFWKSRSKAAYYLVFVGIVLNIVGPHLGLYAFLPEVNVALAWTLAQETPFTRANFLVVQIDQRYVPLAQLGLRTLLGGPGAAIGPLLGIFTAHLFLFATELLPQAGGLRLFAEPPKLLKLLDKMEENKQKEKQYGRARRLGK